MNNKTKVCSRCKLEHNLTCFGIRAAAKDGLKYWCKGCEKEHRDSNKHRRSEYDKKRNKGEIRARDKRHYQANKDKINERNKEYFKENKEKYYKARKQRRKEDPTYRLKLNVSSMVCRALKRQQGSKAGDSTFDCLPYTIDELKQHIEAQFEEWMEWENWGKIGSENRTWNIDHIIPQSKLPYDSMEHPNFLKCWALSNLKPMCSRENIIKGSKII